LRGAQRGGGLRVCVTFVCGTENVVVATSPRDVGRGRVFNRLILKGQDRLRRGWACLEREVHDNRQCAGLVRLEEELEELLCDERVVDRRDSGRDSGFEASFEAFHARRRAHWGHPAHYDGACSAKEMPGWRSGSWPEQTRPRAQSQAHGRDACVSAMRLHGWTQGSRQGRCSRPRGVEGIDEAQNPSRQGKSFWVLGDGTGLSSG